MSEQDILQYRELLGSLQRAEIRVETLRNIINFFDVKSDEEVVNIIQNVGFIGVSKLLRCLDAENKAELDLACEIITTSFKKFSPGDFIKKYTGHIMFLLRHTNKHMKKLAIDLVYKAMITGPDTLPLPYYSDVYVAVSHLVADKETGIANKSLLMTSNLPYEAYERVLPKMKVLLEYDASTRCNVFEVIVNMSRLPEMLYIASEHEYIDYILAELEHETEDVLCHLNYLELLSRIAVTKHGIKLLLDKGSLEHIANVLVILKEHPLWNLIQPGYIKFLGAVSYNYPCAVVSRCPAIAYCLFQAFETNDMTLLPVALSVLGFLGTSIEGKLTLGAVGAWHQNSLEKIKLLLRDSPTDIKVRALQCLADLVGYEKDPKSPKYGPIDPKVTILAREWFSILSSRNDPMRSLFEMCKNPFPDIKLASLDLMDSACQHQWGEELVARTPGLIEFLLDRRLNNSKPEKEAKFQIIKRLSRSTAFDADTIIRMNTYLEEGPYYSNTGLLTAMENAS